MNEILLIASLVLIYGSVILFYRFFGREGLYCFNALVTVLANIEVLLIIDAFHMEMTLGNVLFASTFLVTDILSENHGKKAANRAVILGVLSSAFFIVISQMWLRYIPSDSDWAMEAFQTIFSNTPRLVFASLIVYAITQAGDVWLYHWWWAWTEKRLGDARKGLWLRNNGSTLISQFCNSLLYTFFAFYGSYTLDTLMSIVLSSYVIFIVTSLLDTPVVYLCRKIHEKQKKETVL
ncbi:MAG: queuosine precursor transporter [Lachnospiraceae bacterium]|nr:queuosine precursor transporter [Lachnospiraceae bacterium]